MYKGILHTHYLVVTLFLLLYVIKTVLLLSNKNELLTLFSKKTKLFEIIISFLFLGTGIYLLTQLPFGGKFDYLFWIKLIMVFGSIPIAIIGFRKHNKMLAALSLLLITGAFGLAEVYHKRKGIPKDIVEKIEISLSNGKSLFETNCTLCHGNDGKQESAGAANLSTITLNTEQVKYTILNGKGLMNKVAVTNEQATAIAEYVSANIKGH